MLHYYNSKLLFEIKKPAFVTKSSTQKEALHVKEKFSACFSPRWWKLKLYQRLKSFIHVSNNWGLVSWFILCWFRLFYSHHYWVLKFMFLFILCKFLIYSIYVFYTSISVALFSSLIFLSHCRFLLHFLWILCRSWKTDLRWRTCMSFHEKWEDFVKFEKVMFFLIFLKIIKDSKYISHLDLLDVFNN